MSLAARLSLSPSRTLRVWVTLVSGLAGCYSPPSLQEGAPCERTEQCPDPQRCVLGSCSLREPPTDAAPPSDARTDAAIDAAVDAMPLACSTVGLSCTGGTVTMFSCGGDCRGPCPASGARGAARAAGAGRGGAAGLGGPWQGAVARGDGPAREGGA